MATGRRPGFAETMKQGWRPPERRAGGAGQSAPGKGSRRKGRSRQGASNGASVPPELVKRREELSRRLTELQWDLGGMAYEMASRDHYRLDVLNKQAAKLQEVDAELGQIEHVLKLDQAGASGSCPSCGAMHARGAVFCWQCGNELKAATKGNTGTKGAKGANGSKMAKSSKSQ
jgi:hypothetical protein